MRNFSETIGQFPLGCTADWQPADRLRLAELLPPQQHHWLLDTDSLTAKLKAQATQFRVSLLGQQPAAILPDEQQWLDQATATVREVILWCDQQPWVFARSVFPQPALMDEQLNLSHLGERPLGEHLFRQPDLTRGDIEVARFDDQSTLGQLNQRLGFPAQPLWGRRSCFSAAGQQVLVAEVFLGPAAIYHLAEPQA